MPRKGRAIAVPVSIYSQNISALIYPKMKGKWTYLWSEGVGVLMLKRQERKDGDDDQDPKEYKIPHLLPSQLGGFGRSAYDNEREGCGDGEMHHYLRWQTHPEGFSGY